MVLAACERPEHDWPRRWGRRFDGGGPRRFGRLADVAADTQGWFRVEEIEEDGALVVRAELPGIDSDKDVEVSVSASALHIEARREQLGEAERQGVVWSEFRSGELRRDLAPVDGAGEDAVGASCMDGILGARVPLPAAERRGGADAQGGRLQCSVPIGPTAAVAGGVGWRQVHETEEGATRLRGRACPVRLALPATPTT